jgi:UDP-N-acetylglucosamine 2-epimerase (non-hydrolysing)
VLGQRYRLTSILHFTKALSMSGVSKPTVMSVIGTRPEAIKMAPVIMALDSTYQIEHIVVCTAQHRQMLDTLLKFFGIQCNYDLDVMQNRQSLVDLTVRILRGMKKMFAEVLPNLVLVQGDTTTVLATALSAFYAKIDVGHVEAGLRTRNRYDPYPEEMNRRLVSSLTRFHFAPTNSARANLMAEGVDPAHILITGNTVIDTLLMTASRDLHTAVKIPTERMILLTTHRRESIGAPMQAICNAVIRILDDDKTLSLVLPVHPNPAVREVIYDLLAGRERMLLIEPCGYPEFVALMKRSTLVLTDSGGVQEEAPSLGKPVLVLRNTSERPEGIEAGNARLVGTDEDSIVQATKEILEDPHIYNAMAHARNPYGDGLASRRIVARILKHFGLSSEYCYVPEFGQEVVMRP